MPDTPEQFAKFSARLDELAEIATELAEFDRQASRRGEPLTGEQYWALWDLWVEERLGVRLD